MTPKELLTIFDEAHKANNGGIPAPIVGAKDANLASKLLKIYSPAQLTRWAKLFFIVPNVFIMGSGYTFGVFYSQIGIVIQYDKRMVAAGAARPAPSQNLRDIRKQIDDEWRSR